MDELLPALDVFVNPIFFNTVNHDQNAQHNWLKMNLRCKLYIRLYSKLNGAGRFLVAFGLDTESPVSRLTFVISNRPDSIIEICGMGKPSSELIFSNDSVLTSLSTLSDDRFMCFFDDVLSLWMLL